MRLRRTGLTILAALCWMAPAPARAQSSPADLTELSFRELLDLDVAEHLVDEDEAGYGRLHIGYRYARAEFEGYRDGSHRVLLSQIQPPGGPFPIAQKKIVQEAHIVDVAYDLGEKLSFDVVVPYIRQSTDHVSLAPGFAAFTITSDGIGDVTLTSTYKVRLAERHLLRFTGGVSFPSGSINEKGDTPSPGPRNPLPYTMQLGSGTWDIPLGVGYDGLTESLPGLGVVRFGARVNGRIRTGRNSASYRLGHRLVASAWLRTRPFSWIEPSLRVSAEFWGRIHGRDARLPGPPALPGFPTPVVDPSLFGGRKVLALGGLRLRWPEGLLGGFGDRFFQGQSIEAEAGRPVYQYLNGPQPEEDWRVQVAWRAALF